MLTVYLMRGLPGSGKSTTAREICARHDNARILSTDDYFVGPDGIYRFDRNLIGHAHQWNQDRFRLFMPYVKTLIVDNTNTRKWEMAPYVKMAQSFDPDCLIHIVEPTNWWAFKVKECWHRNTHGVPFDAIMDMKQRYEPVINISDILSEAK